MRSAMAKRGGECELTTACAVDPTASIYSFTVSRDGARLDCRLIRGA